jgi:7-cyano-7-deazaguanine synthase
LKGDKFTILQDGEVLCEELGLNFDEVYKRTNTSYKPIWIPTPVNQEWLENELLAKIGTEKDLIKTHEHYVGDWYSDYKSASSVERVEAFIKLGRKDPAPYADETGPVTWETARDAVQKVLTEHN